MITGRTKFFLNVVGSQLSEEKLDDAILEVSRELGITINEYSVAALKNENRGYIHQWIVVCDEQPDENKLAERLDLALKKANKNYEVARSKALKGVAVTSISKSQYYHYLEQGKKKGGQVKTPKVMKEGKMKDFLQSLGS